jgi:hypothetical protein
MSVLCLGAALNLASFSNLPAKTTQALLNPDNLTTRTYQIVNESPKPGNGRRESKTLAQSDSRQGSSPIRGNGRRDTLEQTPFQI